jgi:hypothetical protein
LKERFFAALRMANNSFFDGSLEKISATPLVGGERGQGRGLILKQVRLHSGGASHRYSDNFP